MLKKYIPRYILKVMKLKNKNVRKLLKIGKTSLASTLPKEMTDALGWREKQRVVIKRVRGGLLIKDWRSPLKPKGGVGKK